MAVLQQQYQDSVAQREGLKERKKLTALRLERASVLITALSDEKVCKKRKLYNTYCSQNVAGNLYK